LQRKYGEKARHVHLKTIQWQITKFERDLMLRRNGIGGEKTAIVDKNIKKVLEQSPRRSVRTISKRTKLAQTSKLRSKFIPVLKRKKILGTCYFQQDGAPYAVHHRIVQNMCGR
jgi:hypothetical protein